MFGHLRQSAKNDPHGWRMEGRDLMAAIAGGSIVGMPLIYTMEVWSHGMVLSESHKLALLGAILVANFLFNFLSGFRQTCSVLEVAMETVTSVGIGIVVSALLLGLIGELGPGMSYSEILGKILIEAAVISVGVSFANAQIRNRSRTGDDQEPSWKREQDHLPREWLQLRDDLADAGAVLAGATVFTLNLAPTEEITLIAARLAPWQLLVMLLTAVFLCYGILFASGFEEHRVHVPSVMQHAWAETAMTCALSLLIALSLLWLIGDPSVFDHPLVTVSSVVVLGLPAIVGGAAGRLIV